MPEHLPGQVRLAGQGDMAGQLATDTLGHLDAQGHLAGGSRSIRMVRLWIKSFWALCAELSFGLAVLGDF